MWFAISQPKMVRLLRNKKQTNRLNPRPEMWPSGLTLAITLTLNFQVQTWNLLYLSQKWSDHLETKSKHIDWPQGLKCEHWVWRWPWPCPWFSRSNMSFAISHKKKWSDCHEMKSKYWLNCRPQMGPMGLTLAITLIFEFSRSNVT